MVHEFSSFILIYDFKGSVLQDKIKRYFTFMETLGLHTLPFVTALVFFLNQLLLFPLKVPTFWAIVKFFAKPFDFKIDFMLMKACWGVILGWWSMKAKVLGNQKLSIIKKLLLGLSQTWALKGTIIQKHSNCLYYQAIAFV